MVGTSPPKLLRMPISEIQERLAESSLDIGMCGLFLTLERLELFDFVNPFYQPSGFQAVVVSPTPQLSVSDLLLAMLGCFDSKTQLIGLFLLLFVFGFGHIAAALENFSFSEARNLRSGYGESTMDGMWIAANVMSSVRFGAVLPKSLPGRILTVVWAYLSIALTGMFVGLIISNFLAMRLIPDYPQYHIAQPRYIFDRLVNRLCYQRRAKIWKHISDRVSAQLAEPSVQGLAQWRLPGSRRTR